MSEYRNGSDYSEYASTAEEVSDEKQASGEKPADKMENTSNWYCSMHKPAIFSLITAAISLFLLVFSFLPFINVRTTHGEENYYTTSFSPTEIVGYSFKIFVSYDSAKELKRSDEYKSFNKAYGKAEDISTTRKLSDTNKEKLQDFAKAAIALELVSSGENIKLNLIAASIMTIAYMGFLLAAFGMSIAAFIKAMMKYPGAEDFIRFAKKTLVMIALLFPIYLLVLAEASRFTLVPAWNFTEGALCFGDGGVSLAAGPWLSFIPLALIAVYAGYACYLKMAETSVAFSKSKDKYRIISLLILIAALISIFLPAMSVSAAYPKSKKTVEKGTEYVSLTDIYEFSGIDSDFYFANGPYYDDEIEAAAELIAKDEANVGAGAEILHGLIHSFDNMSILYVLTNAFAILFILFLALIIKKCLGNLIAGEKTLGAGKLYVLAAISAALYLIMLATLALMANAMLSIEASRYVTLSIGVGPILAPILLAASFVFLGLRPPKEKESKFDNPDVSLAPYVIN